MMPALLVDAMPFGVRWKTATGDDWKPRSDWCLRTTVRDIDGRRAASNAGSSRVLRQCQPLLTI